MVTQIAQKWTDNKHCKLQSKKFIFILKLLFLFRNQIYETIERTMKPPLGEVSGSGVLMQVGVDSKLGIEAEKLPGMLKLRWESNPENAILNQK